jgi:hypothetical protein
VNASFTSPSPIIATIILAAAILPLPATAVSGPPVEPYEQAPLKWKGWPPPEKYAQLARPGECLVIRVPDDQSYYCPPGAVKIIPALEGRAQTP